MKPPAHFLFCSVVVDPALVSLLNITCPTLICCNIHLAENISLGYIQYLPHILHLLLRLLNSALACAGVRFTVQKKVVELDSKCITVCV
jgi:hypothetical protein